MSAKFLLTSGQLGLTISFVVSMTVSFWETDCDKKSRMRKDTAAE